MCLVSLGDGFLQVFGGGGHAQHTAAGGEDLAILVQQLAGSGMCHGHGQLLTADAGPEGQLLVELIAANGAEVIAARIEEQILQQGLGAVHRGGLAGTELAIDLQQCLLVALAAILLQGSHNALIITEALQNLGIGLETEGTDEDVICVSGGMTLHYNGMSSCLFGGSKNLLRNNLRASHFFNFRRICHSIDKGNNFHDLGYVLLEKTPPAEDGSLGVCKAKADFEGILSFKKSFGSDYIEYIGEYVLVSNKALFFSYTHLLQKARNVQSVVNRVVRKLR